VLYVAVTRAVRRLHLVAVASRREDGTLAAPAANSLLARLWPAGRGRVRRCRRGAGADSRAGDDAAHFVPRLWRLAAPAIPECLARAAAPAAAAVREEPWMPWPPMSARWCMRCWKWPPTDPASWPVAAVAAAGPASSAGWPGAAGRQAEARDGAPRAPRLLATTLASADGQWVLRPRADAGAELAIARRGRWRRNGRKPAWSTAASSRTACAGSSTTRPADLGAVADAARLAAHAEDLSPQLEAYAALFAGEGLPLRLAVFYVARILASWIQVWNEFSGFHRNELTILGNDMSDKKYRLVTRSDFDGLVCAVLLNETGPDRRNQVRPSQGHAGRQGRDHRARHHHQPALRPGRAPGLRPPCFGDLPQPRRAPQPHHLPRRALRGARGVRALRRQEPLPGARSTTMMLAVDKSDSASSRARRSSTPADWVLLNYLMDSRTGLGRFREFRVSNYQLMMDLIAYCRSHGIDDILALPDVKERVDLYFDHAEKAKEQIRAAPRCTRTSVVLDLRNEEIIYATNRFMIYALFPSATSRSTCCGACRSRTPCSPPASRSSTAARTPTSAS
jgi:hypothetical protein